MARKRIRATHRLRRPHGVIFDPARHFVKGIKTGERCTLPAGTHVIPTEGQLANMPDRFQALRVAGTPASRVIDDGVVDETNGDGGEDESTEGAGDGEDETGEDEGTGEETTTEDDDDEGGEGGEDDADEVDPRAAVDEALAAVGGDWDALTSSVLEKLAGAYGITDIEGSGATGNVVKADYLRVVQGAHGVVD